ncbi:hypothetical protein [Streptomyces halstedii]|uniref:hypothetical protein n=1 Tax=Streptomyces halstedii TaxID=1944 RepID=UPI00367840B3
MTEPFFDPSLFEPTPEEVQAAQQRKQEAARRDAEAKAAASGMTETAKQRARVDALIVWVEERLETLNYSGVTSLTQSDLVFPDPHRTADAPESKPRRNRTDKLSAAALAFLEDDK